MSSNPAARCDSPASVPFAPGVRGPPARWLLSSPFPSERRSSARHAPSVPRSAAFPPDQQTKKPPDARALPVSGRGALHREVRSRLRVFFRHARGTQAAPSGLRAVLGARGDRWVVVATDLLRAPHCLDALLDAEERSRLDRLQGSTGRCGEGEGGCLLVAREVGEQDEVVVTERIEAAGDASPAAVEQGLDPFEHVAVLADLRGPGLAGVGDLEKELCHGDPPKGEIRFAAQVSPRPLVFHSSLVEPQLQGPAGRRPPRMSSTPETSDAECLRRDRRSALPAARAKPVTMGLHRGMCRWPANTNPTGRGPVSSGFPRPAWRGRGRRPRIPWLFAPAGT